VSSGEHAPVVAIVTNLIVLAVGIALWIQRGWAWLAVGSGLMFVAAGAFGSGTYALSISNLGEICITLGFIATCVRFARLKQRSAGAAGAPVGAPSGAMGRNPAGRLS
jgi:1,4-dihydroxy-2-naphthoate octaprenyltransferase